MTLNLNSHLWLLAQLSMQPESGHHVKPSDVVSLHVKFAYGLLLYPLYPDKASEGPFNSPNTWASLPDV